MTINFEPHAIVTWLDDVQAIHIEWKKLYMSLERFQEICVSAIGILSEHQGDTWIADQYESEGVFSKTIKDVISGDLHAMAKHAGITKVLTIMPQEVGLSSLNTKSWIRDVNKKEGIATVEFPTLETCKEWILENKDA